MTDQQAMALRAEARGYREMLNDAIAALFYIADENPAQGECVHAAKAVLSELGLRDE